MKIKADTKRAIRLFLSGIVVSLLFVAASFFITGPSNTAHAAINNEINFQGKLTNPNGTNVTDGTYSVVFSLYTASSGGSAVWTETDSVTTVSGIFQLNLGAVTALPGSVNFDSANLYLGIKVGTDAEMTPRIQFTAVPQAFQANNSDNLGGVAAASYAQLAVNQTFTATEKFQPTTNINGVDIEQNSSGSFGQDVFDVQGSSGGTNNFIQVTSTAANQGAVTIASLGSNNLTLNSGSNTISVGATTIQGTGALSLASLSGQNLTLDTGGGTSTVNIGIANATTVQIGRTTGAVNQTINVGTNATSSATNTVSIGTASTATDSVSIGSANVAGDSVSITGGSTGGVTLTGTTNINNNAGTNTTNIGTGTTTGAIAIGGNADTLAINTSNWDITNLGVASGLTGLSSSGSIAFSGLSTNGVVTTSGGTGTLGVTATLGVANGGTGAGTLATGGILLGNGTSAIGALADITAGSCLQSNGAGSNPVWGSCSSGSYITNGITTQATANFNIQSAAAADVGGVIEGASSQSADLLDLRDSTGANLTAVSAAGNIESIGYIDNGIGGIGQYSNLLLYSELFTNAAWTSTNLTTTNPGTIVAPDGQTTGNSMVSTLAGGTLKQTYSSAGNNTYTYSVWLRASTATQPVSLQINSNGTPATGTVASFTATTTWQRFSVTQTFSGATTTVTPTITITNNAATVYGWGAQLVQASNAEVYTRTTASTVAASSGVVSNGGLFVSSRNSTDVPIVVQSAPSQTGDLLDFQNSSGFILAGFTAAGVLSGTNQTSGNVAGGNLQVQGGSGVGTGSGGQLTLQGGAAGGTTAAAGGAVAITAGAGSSATAGGAGGNVTITSGNATGTGNNNGGTITLQAGSATGSGTVGGVLVKGAANSTTAFQVQNSTGTNLLNVNTSGTSVNINALAAPGTVTASLSPVAPVLTKTGTGTASYAYEVVGVDANGAKTMPSPASTTSTTAPNTLATGGSYQESLNITSTGAVEYLIYRTLNTAATGGTGSATLGLIGETTTTGAGAFVDTGQYASQAVPTSPGSLTNGTTYYYSVTAIDGTGGQTVGSAVVNKAASTVTNNAITLSWNPVTGARGYNIYYNVGATLTAGTSYSYFTSYTNSFTMTTTSANTATLPTINTAYDDTLSTSGNSQITLGNVTSSSSSGQLDVAGNLTTSAIGSISTGTGSAPNDVYVSGNYAYVVNTSTNTLNVFNVAIPTNPVQIGSISTGASSSPEQIYVAGNYAYVTIDSPNQLNIYNISNPSTPVLAGSVSTGATGSQADAIYVSGSYAYVTSQNSNTLQVINVSNPSNPVVVGSIVGGLSIPVGVYTEGNYTYVAGYTDYGLMIYNTSNPANPINVGVAGVSGNPSAVTVSGSYAYVTSTNYTGNTGYLSVINISNPASPVTVSSTQVGTAGQSFYTTGLSVSGHYLYLSGSQSGAGYLDTYDISNPTDPISVVSDHITNSPSAISAQGRYAYVTDSSSNVLQVYDLGGAYIQQLQVGNTETGTLEVDADANINGDLNLQGSLIAGSGIMDSGNLSVAGTVTGNVLVQNSSNTSSAFQVNNSTGANEIGVNTTANTVNLGDSVSNVTYVTHQAVTPATGTTVTSSAFTVSGTDPALIVTIAASSATATVSSVTWSLGGGTPYQVSSVRNGATYVSVWAIPAPTAGSGTYTVNLSASVPYQADAQEYDYTNQTTPAPTGDAVTTTGGVVTALNLTPSNVTGGDAEAAVAATTGYVGDGNMMYPNGDNSNTTTAVNFASGYQLGSGVMNAQFAANTGQVTAMVAIHIVAVSLVSGNQVLSVNSATPTTGLTVTSASGTNVLSVNTQNNAVTINAPNQNFSAGANLVTNDFSNTSHWTTTNTGSWTLSTGTATYAYSGTAATLKENQFTPTVGTPGNNVDYEYSYTVSGLATGNAGVQLIFGNTYSDAVTANGTYTGYTYAGNNTSPVEFAVSASVSITNVSFELVNGVSAASSSLVVQNASGTAFSVQATTDLNSIFLGTGSGTYAVAGSDNTAVGDYTLNSGENDYSDTVLGYGAAFNNQNFINSVAIGGFALQNGDYDAEDVAVGLSSQQYGGAQYNTSVGDFSLRSNSGGYSNAFGYNALLNSTTGTDNDAFGMSALQATTIGSYNTSFGDYSLEGVTTSSNNTAIGASSGDDYNYTNPLTTGSGDTFIGSGTGTASGNVATLQNSTSVGIDSEVDQSNSLVLGCVSGTNNCTTTTEVGIGITSPSATLNVVGNDVFKSGTSSTSAFVVQNTSGVAVLGVDTTNNLVNIRGINSTATLGTELMTSNTNFTSGWTGTGWTFNSSSATHTSGTTPAVYSGFTPVAGNTYQIVFTFTGGNGTDSITPNIGGSSGQVILANSDTNETQVITATNTGSLEFIPTTAWAGSITYISVKLVTQANASLQVLDSTGAAALQVGASTATNLDTFIGLSSGQDNTTGYAITATGAHALQDNTAGSFNTASGTFALQDNTIGTGNTGLGAHALQDNTAGSFNTASGTFALQDNVDGAYNTATGVGSLYSNNSGSYNTGTGYYALYQSTTGSYNTVSGFNSLLADTTGSSNTASGFDVLENNTTGSNNIALGYQAGYTNTSANGNTSGSGNTFLGSNSGPGVASSYNLQNATAVGIDSTVDQDNALILGCVNGVNGCTASTNVGIGSAYATSNPLSVSNTTYSTGTISQTTYSITGSGTTWTSAMNGATIIYSDGTTATVTYLTATTLTSSVSKSVTAGSSYTIVYAGDNFSSSGALTLQNTTNSTSAFQVQNAGGSTTVLGVDTTNDAVAINGGASSTATTLSVTAGSSQTADLVDFTGTAYSDFSINDYGRVTTTSGMNINNAHDDDGPVLGATNALGSTVAVWVMGASGQTADLYENQNSSGTVLSEFTASGALQGGNASGSNVAGTNLVLAGGEGTGTGAGGNINLNIYKPGGSGSTNNTTVSTVLSLNGSNGAALLQNTTNSTAALQVQNASSAALLTADTTNMRLGVDVTYASMSSPAPTAAVPTQSATPTVTPTGTAGSTSYAYIIVATGITAAPYGNSAASVAGTTSTGNATLSAINYNALSWTAYSNATGYYVYRSTGGGTTGYIGYTTTNSFSDTGLSATGTAPTVGGGLTASSTYRYKVTAIDSSGGETTPGTEVSATTGTANTTDTITISWTKVTGAIGYKIYRTAAGGATNTETFLTSVTGATSGTTVSFTDIGAISTSTAYTVPTTNTAYTSTNVTNTNNLELSVGGNGTSTGQVYVSGTVPAAAVSTIATGTSPESVYVSGSYAYIANEGSSTLTIYDISNPASPIKTGSVNTGTNPEFVYVQGRYAYVANYGSSTLGIYDISNPSAPFSVGSIATGTNAGSVYVAGRYAYVTLYNANKLGIYDVSNPASPVSVGTVATGSGPDAVVVQGHYAYVANYTSNTIGIYDVSNPASPVLVGTVATGAGPTSIYVQGRYAYTSNYTASTLGIYDISNPASPLSVSTIAASSPDSVYVQGRYAYVANSGTNTLGTYDISNPSSPVSVGSVSTGASSNPYWLYVSGRYAYVANAGSSTLSIFDLGGEYSQQLQAGGAEVGTLQVDSNENIVGNSSIQGGLNVGAGLQVAGTVGVNGSLNLTAGTALASPSAPTLVGATTGGTLPTTTTYYYKVAAINGNSITNAVASSPASYTTSTATSSVKLTWSAVTGATGYIVYRSTDGATWFSNDVNSSTLGILDNGTNYTWTSAASPLTTTTNGGNLIVGGSIQGVSTNGTNTAGSNLNISGGQGTGTGNGGNIVFQIAAPTTTGSTQNGLTTVATISGASGAVTFTNAVNSTAAFQVNNSSGNSEINVNTTANTVNAGDTVADVTYVTHQSVTPATGTSVTSSAFSVSGTDPTLILNIAADSTTATISSVSWSLGGGTPYQVSSIRNGATYVSVWAIPAPTAGSGTYTVHFSASVAYQVDAEEFDNVNQTTPAPTADAVTNTSGENPSISLTPNNVSGGDAEEAVGASTVSGTYISVTPISTYSDSTNPIFIGAGYQIGPGAMIASFDQGTGQVSAMAAIHIDAATLVTGNPVLSVNAANPTTALSVENASGASVLSVNTLNNEVTINAAPYTAPVGPDLVTDDFGNAAHWTAYNSTWTLGTNNASFSSSSTGGNITEDQFTPTAGALYEYSYTVSNMTNSNNDVQLDFANNYIDATSHNGTFTGYVYPNNTSDPVSLALVSPGTVTFSNISFELVTGVASASTALAVQDSYGTALAVQDTPDADSMILGVGAGSLENGGYANTIIGDGALTIGQNNQEVTALGTDALQYSDGGLYADVFIGNLSGAENSYLSGSVGIGVGSLQYGSGGTDDVAIGSGSQQYNAGHYDNSLGYDSLQNVSSGYGNNAVGSSALQFATTGYDNNGFGANSLYAVNSGYGNTGIGDSALYGVNTGNVNTALGSGAGDEYGFVSPLTGGSWNTFLGAATGTSSGNVATLQNATAVGAYSEVDESNALTLGCVNGTNSCPATTEVGIGTTSPDYNLSVVGSNSGGAIESIVNTYGTTNTYSTALRVGTDVATGHNARLITFYAGASADNNGTAIGNLEENGGTNLQLVSGSADYGEYFNTDNNVSLGDIVQENSNGTAQQANSDSAILGVISNTSEVVGNATNNDDSAVENGRAVVGLLGQIATNVTTENGPISAGDPITVSSTVPGYGTDLNGSGKIVGYALANFDPANGEGTAVACPAGTASGVVCGSIEVKVAPTYYSPSSLDLIQQGGNATLDSLAVTGTADFANLNASGLSTINDLSVQTLAVSGNITVAGTLTVTGLTSVADISISGHIITAGGEPTSAAQAAAGTGATVSISGDDTTGTITITTGSNPTSGALSDITFSKIYSSAPHVVLSPSNAAASDMHYFKGTTTANDFMLNTTDTPAANTTYQYDYFIAQ